MYGQTLPPSARAYDHRHRTESAAARSALERLWGRMGQDFDTSYARIESRVLATTLLAPILAAKTLNIPVPQPISSRCLFSQFPSKIYCNIIDVV